MKKHSPTPAAVPSHSDRLFARIGRVWNDFFFTPADPTVLGLIRVVCGMVTLYTIFAYCFSLQDFMGENAWYDLKRIHEVVHDQPWQASALDGQESEVLNPRTDRERADLAMFVHLHGFRPAGAYPDDPNQVAFINEYARKYNADPRAFGLPLPTTPAEFEYLDRYTKRFGLPPPAYELNPAKAKEIEDYIDRNRIDPRRVYARGNKTWSLWFHVTDPTAMAIIHGVVVFIVFLFTIGFCTRVTSALTWMTSLWYIHRNYTILFGVDTMMTIILLYLTIGPSGAAYSVDRLIARWWSKNKLRVINGWRNLWSRPALGPGDVEPALYSVQPVPSAGANFAIRLLQIHLCIIYFISGIAKLQGPGWWEGRAIWGTLANFEFAPMQFEPYNEFLRLLGDHLWVWQLFLTLGCIFTLAFEIFYPCLVWWPRTRWAILSGAIVLHGLIGMFMGLKTFALMMLAFNMAFLKPEEVRKVMGFFGWFVSAPPPSAVPPPKSGAKFEAAARAKPEPAAVGSSHIKDKK